MNTTPRLDDALLFVGEREESLVALVGFRHPLGSSAITNLPEEQATEFEKFDNFTQLLRGVGTEGDTQFGITDKQFRFNDFNAFLADDWRLSRVRTGTTSRRASDSRGARATSAWSCAVAMASSSTGHRRRSSTRSSATTRSCVNRK